ncbi:MAG: zinc-ribbon domain-containing protein [Candidatus Jordarchaeaceae archaeon]
MLGKKKAKKEDVRLKVVIILSIPVWIIVLILWFQQIKIPIPTYTYDIISKYIELQMPTLESEQIPLYNGLYIVCNYLKYNQPKELADTLIIGYEPTILLLVLIYYGIRRKGAEGKYPEPITAPIELRSAPTPTPEPDSTSISLKLGSKCSFCGAEISSRSKFCPRCGVARSRCLICNELITARTHAKCPYCGTLYHRDHLLEWVMVKGYCPNCGRSLKVFEIV